MKLVRMAALVLVLAAPAAVALGQTAGKVPRLTVLLFEPPAASASLTAFVAGLRDLGYIEGRNVALEHRSAEGRPEPIPEAAAQALALRSDVLVVLGGDMVPSVKDAGAWRAPAATSPASPSSSRRSPASGCSSSRRRSRR